MEEQCPGGDRIWRHGQAERGVVSVGGPRYAKNVIWSDVEQQTGRGSHNLRRGQAGAPQAVGTYARLVSELQSGGCHTGMTNPYQWH